LRIFNLLVRRLIVFVSTKISLKTSSLVIFSKVITLVLYFQLSSKSKKDRSEGEH